MAPAMPLPREKPSSETGSRGGELREVVEGGERVCLGAAGAEEAAAPTVACGVEDEGGDAFAGQQMLRGKPVIDGFADAVA